MKKALINYGLNKILHVVLPADVYHNPYPDPALGWVDVADDTTERDSYVSGAVVKQVLPQAVPADSQETSLLAALAAPANPSFGGIDLLKLVKALAISNEAFRLGKLPGALTGAELTAMRNRLAAIYKAL